jgi:hypothetical protein
LNLRKSNLFLFYLIIAITISNVILYYNLGFRVGGDTERYLSSAEDWLNGIQLNSRQFNYIGYIWLCAFIKWLGLPIQYIFGIQIFFSIIATFFAFFVGREYLNKQLGLICGIIWALCFDVHFWNFYLLTDSLFISFVLISFCLVLLSLRRTRKFLILANISIIIMALLRSNGIIFGFILIIFQIFHYKNLEKKVLMALFMLILLILPSSPLGGLLWPIGTQGDTISMMFFDFMKQGYISFDNVKIEMPDQTFFSGNFLIDLFSYILMNFWDVISLWFQRIIHFLFAYNANFSRSHIFFNFIINMFFHASLIFSIFQQRKKIANSFIFIPLGVILMHTLFIMITITDYDGRWVLYMRPFELPFLALLIVLFYNKYFRNLNNIAY